jgi:hypothetical protein
VRKESQIPDLLKRIAAGPITIILVYADWCGHCHTYKPAFMKTIKHANNTTQVASLNETMVDSVNKALHKNNANHKPISVEGYPSITLVDKNGNHLKNIPRESLEKTLKQAGPLAEESISAQPINANANRNANNSIIEPLYPQEPDTYEPVLDNERPRISNSKSNNLNGPTTLTPMSSVTSYKPKNLTSSITSAESDESDDSVIRPQPHTGGSLYSKITSGLHGLDTMSFTRLTTHRSKRRRTRRSIRKSKR